MAQFDLPLDELREYRPPRDEPADFDAFWAETLDESRAVRAPAVAVDVDSHLETISAADVTFSGYAGQPIKAWLLWPARANGATADDRRSTSATAAGGATRSIGCCGRRPATRTS